MIYYQLDKMEEKYWNPYWSMKWPNHFTHLFLIQAAHLKAVKE